MRKLSEKQKAKLVYTQIFRGTNLKEGECVRFLRGKTIWEIRYKTNGGGYFMCSLSSWNGMYLYPRDFRRIQVVEKEDLLKWILRNRPSEVSRFFKNDKALSKMLRKLISPPKF